MSESRVAGYYLANDPHVQWMADEAMRRFRGAEQEGTATPERVKPFMRQVLAEERGILDPETEADYLAAMGRVLALRPRRPRLKPLTVPQLADCVTAFLRWLKNKDRGRKPSHFMQALNHILNTRQWSGERNQVASEVIKELNIRRVEAAMRSRAAKQTSAEEAREPRLVSSGAAPPAADRTPARRRRKTAG